MNAFGLRTAGAAAVLMLGIWAGAKYHVTHPSAAGRPEMPVPAGKSSPPSPSDLVQSTDDATPILKIPDRLPDFSLQDRAGRNTPISAFAGRSLVINFWATWCAPCRSEIPLLEKLHTEWADRGVSVIGIAVDHRDKVVEFADRFKIAYPLLIGEQDALDAVAAFGVETPVFPFTVFTDRRGEVVSVFVGELHRPQAEFILSAVHDLDGGRVDLPAARHTIADGLRRLKPPG